MTGRDPRSNNEVYLSQAKDMYIHGNSLGRILMKQSSASTIGRFQLNLHKTSKNNGKIRFLELNVRLATP